MKTRIIALIAGLLAVLPMTSAWGSSTTYYASLKVAASSNSPTGAGSVYASTDSKAASGSATATGSGSSTSGSATVTIYGFAKESAGFQFNGWSENADGSGPLKTDMPYKYSVTSTDTSQTPQPKNIYAVFSKIVLPEFSVTCADGNYTVNGGAPGTLTQTEAVTVTLASADPKFFCWKINGTSYTDNPHVQTFSTSAEISAQFLTAESIVEVTTYEDLKSALANDRYLKITVPSGASLTVAKGDTLTVPVGKALVLNRPLVVAGTFTNNGMLSGSGKVLKVSYMISQGDVIKLHDGNGEECGNMDLKSFKPHYRPTTVTANTPSVTMGSNTGCGESWAVTFGGNAYTISKQSPKALKVTFDTAIAANHIKSIADNADVDSVGDNDAVLLADCKIVGTPDTSKRAVYSKTVDCAGKTATMDAKDNSNKIAASNALFLNGKVSITPSNENQNSKATFINCTSVTLSKIKGTSPAYGFYACGTKESPLSLSFGYYNSTRGDNYRTAYFHNGYYKYTFNSTDDGGGKCVVKGGNFRGSDPTAYIPSALNDVIWAPEDKTANYFVVQPKPTAEKFVSMNGVEYESLEKALEDAPDNTKTTIELIAGLDLTGSTVTIGANKNIYLRLSKHLIEGVGKIVNNGTLTVTDSAANECTVACAFENHGALEFIFGKYTGDIVNKAGVLTVHNGVFTGSLTKDGGTVNLKGGCFANDISSFVTADGYRIRSGKQPYCVCEMPDGTLYDLSIKGVMGYGATPYALSAADGHSADYDILSKYVKDAKKSESDYSSADWPRLAELVTFADVFNGKALDATLIFDRFVKKSSLTFNVMAGSDENACDFYLDLPANTPYRGLTEFLMRAPFGPYYAKTYEDIFAEEIKSVGASIVDKSSGSANAGTVCTFEIELWQRERGPNYASNGEMLTNTICVVGSRRFTIGAGSNVAMIRPETGAATFYPTLKAACEAAQNGETVMLCNDSTTCEPISKPCSFRFDANGFAAPNGFTAVAEYELSEVGGLYAVAKPTVAITSEDGKTVAAVSETPEVTQKAEERAKENGTTVEAEQQKILQETNEETGLKVWQEVVLESAGVTVDKDAKIVEVEKSTETGATENTIALKTEASVSADAGAKNAVQGIGLAKVEISQSGEKILTAVDTTVTKQQEAAVNLADLDTGVYQAALIVNDAAGNPQAIQETKTEKFVVMKTEPKQNEPVVIVAVGDTSVAGENEKVNIKSLIDSSTLCEGDVVRFWNKGKKAYEAWTYLSGNWEPNSMDGKEMSSDAAGVQVPAGAALWFERSKEVTAETKPVAVIAKQPMELKTMIEPPKNGADGKKPDYNWNLIANPNPGTELYLDTIAGGNEDIISVQTTEGRRDFMRDKNGTWSYNKVSYEERTIGGRKLNVKINTPCTDNAKIGAGEGVWYISAGGAPTIDWTKAVPKAK